MTTKCFPITISLVLCMSVGESRAAQTRYEASNADLGDEFGAALAISGNTLVVGAPYEQGNGVDGPSDNSIRSGAVYVFVHDGTAWQEQAYLKASNPGNGAPPFTDGSDRFGGAVAIDGDVLVVGASQERGNGTSQSDDSLFNAGAAYVFERVGTTWTQTAYLKASNPGDADYFGGAVSISGSVIAIGASGEGGDGVHGELDNSVSGSGAVYVFRHDGSGWNQEAYLKASVVGLWHYFGGALALEGDTLVAGSSGESGGGACYVFEHGVGGWSEAARLEATDAEAGDSFGCSVALSGDDLLVGAIYEGFDPPNSPARRMGAAYSFHREGSAWSQVAQFRAPNEGHTDRFGDGTAVSGSRSVVTSRRESAAYLFALENGVWTQKAALELDALSGSGLRKGVAVDDQFVLCGAIQDNQTGAFYSFDSAEIADVAAATDFGSYCYGDGTDGTACPCGNESSPGGIAEGCRNSQDRGAFIGASGSSSLAADDLRIHVNRARRLQAGVVVQGSSQISIPFRDGKLCVGGLTERVEVVFMDDKGYGATTGSIATQGGVPAPGLTRYYQAWYRDPNISACGTGSNLTNAMTVHWVN